MGSQGQDKRTQRALATHASLVHATESLAVLQSHQLDSLGLTMAQFRTLEALMLHGPMSQVALCKELVCGHSNAKFLIDKLHERGLVVRKALEEDHRTKMVRLTPEGQKLIARIFPVHAMLVRAQMSVLEGREQETLRRLCGKLGHTIPPKFVRELVTMDAGVAGETA